MKPPETSRVVAPRARIVRTSVSAPGLGRTRSVRHCATICFIEPAEQGDPLAERAGEIQFALHRALGDRGDLRLDPGIIGEFVDAFLPDHGRIHVGDEQRFLARPGRLDDDVDPFPSLVSRAHRRWIFVEHRGRPRSPSLDPLRTGARCRAARCAASKQPFVEPVRLLSAWRWSKTLPPVALIAGPTASGKSALALALAEATGGAVINADSAQLYRDLPILSAAPSPEEQARAEHRLYGVRDGAEPCSAADWAALAKAEIAQLHAERRLPILVGGTGLYLRTLLDGIAPVPAIDPEIRAEVRAAGVCRESRRADPARPVRRGAAQPRRHHAHRPRARSRALDRADARRMAGAARGRDRRRRSRSGR